MDGRPSTELERRARRLRGVIVTSAKKTFFAGGDLDDAASGYGPDDAAAAFAVEHASKAQLRRLETLGGRWSPRSTAPRSAAAWRSRWPATTGSCSTTRGVESGCPR